MKTYIDFSDLKEDDIHAGLSAKENFETLESARLEAEKIRSMAKHAWDARARKQPVRVGLYAD